MKHLKLTVFFLIINFGSLAFGSWLMNNGPMTDWYTNLNKAPWTPPGWFFGVAWTIIMVCFSIYLTQLFIKNKKNQNFLSFILVIEFILNVSWNYLFFNQHLVLLSLINIILLTIIMLFYFLKLSSNIGNYKYLILPYIVWLCIATSLNLYILIQN